MPGPESPLNRAVGDAIWTRTEQLAGQLRRRGVPVATAELIDAASALALIDMSSRNQVRTALKSTMVKNPHHQTVFDEEFDRWFPARTSKRSASRAGAQPDADKGGDPSTLRQRLELALGRETESDLRLLAEDLVDEHAGLDEGIRTERYHVYRALRAIDLAAILAAVAQRAHELGETVDRSDLEARAELLRAFIAAEVRARLADAPPEPASRPTESGSAAEPFDVELARASASELDDIRAAIRPLARRLAAQLRRRRNSQQVGRIHMRGTIRRSLPSGGVPLDIAYRRPRAHHPEVFVLCDVSGSIAEFSGFTLTLISALADELASTRTFAFVDAIDEISALMKAATGTIEPWQILQSGRVIGADGHSDYGAVLEGFWERYGHQGLTDRSTVIIVGDARGNHRPARPEILGRIAARARRVYWLNPEPRVEWDTTDSTQGIYAEHCTAVLEVRTLRQLSSAVLEIF